MFAAEEESEKEESEEEDRIQTKILTMTRTKQKGRKMHKPAPDDEEEETEGSSGKIASPLLSRKVGFSERGFMSAEGCFFSCQSQRALRRHPTFRTLRLDFPI